LLIENLKTGEVHRIGGDEEPNRVKRHVVKTRDELASCIRGLVYSNIINGGGWHVCFGNKLIENRALESQIDNQSGTDMYDLYIELFKSGILCRMNNTEFKRYDYRGRLPDGGLSKDMSTFIYSTDAQLKEFLKLIKNKA